MGSTSYDPNAGPRGKNTVDGFYANKNKFSTDLDKWQEMQKLKLTERREGMGGLYEGNLFPSANSQFMGENSIGQNYLENQSAGGYGGLPSFNLGQLGDPGVAKDGTDWLGWAGIGTGLLQGAGGIMDYFSNMKGLKLTEQAMNKKYAADDRNYLAQATSLNNVIDTRRDYINKTQGGRNTDFLKNIPLG
jgi:hypothetical protein